MDLKKEIIDAIQIIVDSSIKKSCPSITFGVVTAIGSSNKCTVLINNISYTLNYYGSGEPVINQKYPVFLSGANLSKGFVLTGIGDTSQIYDSTLALTQQAINDLIFTPQVISVSDFFIANPFGEDYDISICQSGKMLNGFIQFDSLTDISDFTEAIVGTAVVGESIVGSTDFNGIISEDFLPANGYVVSTIYSLSDFLPVGSFVLNNRIVKIYNGDSGGYISFNYMIA